MTGQRTKLLHGKSSSIHPLGAHHLPIFRTTTWIFKSVKEARKAFAGRLKQDIYTRISNPNNRELEERLIILEKGKEAQSFASGMGATASLIAAFVKTGEKVISTTPIYGGTYALFTELFQKCFGIHFKFVDIAFPEKIKKAIDKKTKLIFIETPANPTLGLCDLEEIASFSQGIPIAVDSTLATPFNFRPLEFGADIVIHSLTKYLNGRGDSLGGVIVSSKKYMKEINKVYPLLGAVMDAGVASRISINLLDLDDRMRRHNTNALAVARFLDSHPKVRHVFYPGLESHPQHEIAKRKMITWDGQPGFGGMVSFELKGGKRDTVTFLDSLAFYKKSVISLGVSLGTLDSLIECPAQMTHFEVPAHDRLIQGITPGLIRMSVGTEDYPDIEASLKMALDKI